MSLVTRFNFHLRGKQRLTQNNRIGNKRLALNRYLYTLADTRKRARVRYEIATKRWILR